MPPEHSAQMLALSALLTARVASSAWPDRAAVAVQIPVPVPGVRVAPADREHLMALADQVLGHAAAGREVGDVVLVDHRRDDQHRVLVDLLGRRRVLDQLEHLGAEDHRARRDGQIAAHLECARLDHRRDARRLRHVRSQCPEPAQRAQAAGVHQRLDCGRVQQRIVARRCRSDQVGQDEPQPLVIPPVELGVRQQLRWRSARPPGRSGGRA